MSSRVPIFLPGSMAVSVPVEMLGGKEAGKFKLLEVQFETLRGGHELGLFWKVTGPAASQRPGCPAC